MSRKITDSIDSEIHHLEIMIDPSVIDEDARRAHIGRRRKFTREELLDQTEKIHALVRQLR